MATYAYEYPDPFLLIKIKYTTVCSSPKTWYILTGRQVREPNNAVKIRLNTGTSELCFLNARYNFIFSGCLRIYRTSAINLVAVCMLLCLRIGRTMPLCGILNASYEQS